MPNNFGGDQLDPEYAPHHTANKRTRKAMSKKTAKKTSKKTEEQKWHDRAAKLPVGLFFTTMGPIIGKVDKAPSDMGQFRVRLWGPAMVQISFVQPEKVGTEATKIQQRAVFQPLALIETHIDLSTAAPFGRAPVPAALLPSYEEFFAKFVAGEYGLTRIVAKVETGAPHVVDMTQDEPTPSNGEVPAAETSTPRSESDENVVS